MGYKPRFFEKLNQQDGLTPDNADDGLHEVVASERGKPNWVQVTTSAENCWSRKISTRGNRYERCG